MGLVITSGNCGCAKETWEPVRKAGIFFTFELPPLYVVYLDRGVSCTTTANLVGSKTDFHRLDVEPRGQLFVREQNGFQIHTSHTTGLMPNALAVLFATCSRTTFDN